MAERQRTYEIVGDNHGIRCLICGLTSYHPKDIEHLFCGKCNIFHDVQDPVALSEDQYHILKALRDETEPPKLKDSPPRMFQSLYQRGLMVKGPRVSERGLQALHAYETEA